MAPPRLKPGDPVLVEEPLSPPRRGVVVLPPTDGEVLVRYSDMDRRAGDREGWHMEGHVRREDATGGDYQPNPGTGGRG